MTQARNMAALNPKVPVKPGGVLRRSHGPVPLPGDPDGGGHPNQEASGSASGSMGLEAAVLNATGGRRPGGGGPAQLPHAAGDLAPRKQRHHGGQFPCGEMLC